MEHHPKHQNERSIQNNRNGMFRPHKHTPNKNANSQKIRTKPLKLANRHLWKWKSPIKMHINIDPERNHQRLHTNCETKQPIEHKTPKRLKYRQKQFIGWFIRALLLQKPKVHKFLAAHSHQHRIWKVRYCLNCYFSKMLHMSLQITAYTIDYAL